MRYEQGDRAPTYLSLKAYRAVRSLAYAVARAEQRRRANAAHRPNMAAFEGTFRIEAIVALYR